MKLKAIIAALLVCAALLSACGGENAQAGYTESSPAPVSTSALEGENSPSELSAADLSDMFTQRDMTAEYDESESVLIELTGDSASCASENVSISGSVVTIGGEGTYILSGALNDGMIIVNAGENDKPRLVLNGVSINSSGSAAIYIIEADKVFITLAEGSENSLSNGGEFTAIDENNIDGAVFSKQDLSFNGSGSLTISSPAGHGIVCKDDLVFTGGTYTVSAASHGLDANDSVRIAGADLTIDSGKDGIHAENSDDASLGFVYIADGSISIEAQGDGVSAGSYMRIDGGSFDILTGGGSANAPAQSTESWGGFTGGQGGQMPGEQGGQMPDAQGGQMPDGQMMGGRGIQAMDDAQPAAEDSSVSTKGLKAAGDLYINGGSFSIDSADDAVHSNSSISVSGGSFDISSGDDGLHADETLSVSGGAINIADCYEGLEGLYVNISGGELNITAGDDGLNAAGGADQSGFGGPRGGDVFGGASYSGGTVTISGGTVYINASGDGIDANGSLEISGGLVTVSGPVSGDTAVLDYDSSGLISGGTFIGTGALQMAQTFSASTQGVISVNAGNQDAGTLISLSDGNGNLIISYESDRQFNLVILSSPDIVTGQSYTLSVGSGSGQFTAS